MRIILVSRIRILIRVKCQIPMQIKDKNSEAVEAQTARKAEDAQNGGVEAQNGAVEGL